MSYFNKMMEEIGQDEKMPEAVWESYVHTLETLPEKKTKAGRYSYGRKAAAAAACILTAGSLVCYANPALASKIPILGEIFQQVEEITTYSGNYSDSAEVLVSEENQEVKKEYTAQDAGVKVSASEILYDGVSVFLTLKMDIENGNLGNIPKHQAKNGAAEGGSVMYLWGEYEVPGILPPQALTEDSFYLEGKALDDDTYVGMVKMNLGDKELEGGTLALNLSAIGYDDLDSLDSADISADKKMEGSWKLQVPFRLDTEQAKRLTFDTKGKEYGLEKITVSPYQIVTQIAVPYTEREVTREEYEEAMAIKTEGTGIAIEDCGITYEEYAEMEGRTYAESHTLLFNQDGEQITPRGGYGNGKSVFAVEGAEISSLQVLVFDSLDAWLDLDTTKLTEAAIKAAVNYEVVEIK